MTQPNGRDVAIEPFVPGETLSARKLNAVREAALGGIPQDGYVMPEDPGLVFPAKITGQTISGGTYAYYWEEVEQTGATTWAKKQGGREGKVSTPSSTWARELNGWQATYTNLRVNMVEALDSTGTVRYYFAAPMINVPFMVTCQVDGGANGTNFSAPTYTYTVKTLDGSATLGTGVTVSHRRLTVGAVVANVSTFGPGLAYYNTANGLVLWDANEMISVDPCVIP